MKTTIMGLYRGLGSRVLGFSKSMVSPARMINDTLHRLDCAYTSTSLPSPMAVIEAPAVQRCLTLWFLPGPLYEALAP